MTKKAAVRTIRSSAIAPPTMPPIWAVESPELLLGAEDASVLGTEVGRNLAATLGSVDGSPVGATGVVMVTTVRVSVTVRPSVVVTTVWVTVYVLGAVE